jgi:hypothetical protein
MTMSLAMNLHPPQIRLELPLVIARRLNNDQQVSTICRLQLYPAAQARPFVTISANAIFSGTVTFLDMTRLDIFQMLEVIQTLPK